MPHCSVMRANYKMQRLFIEHDLATGGTIELAAQQSHYLANVLRLGEGESATVEGGRWHDWWNASDRDARVLIEVTPGARWRTRVRSAP